MSRFCYIQQYDVRDPQQLISNKWHKNKLTVSFFHKSYEGVQLKKEREDKVKKAVKQWERVCGISFEFTYPNNSSADVRVSFTQNGRSHSMVGTDSIGQNGSSMNLGWVDNVNDDEDGTILHEFGHAIGFLHEHQHKMSRLPWNMSKLREWARRINWTDQDIERNIINQTLIVEDIDKYDKHSVMHYFFDDSFFTEPVGLVKNTKLSDGDIKMAQKIYPIKNENPEVIPITIEMIWDLMNAVSERVETIGVEVNELNNRVVRLQSEFVSKYEELSKKQSLLISQNDSIDLRRRRPYFGSIPLPPLDPQMLPMSSQDSEMDDPALKPIQNIPSFDLMPK